MLLATFIVILNFFLACACCYGAWRLWRWRQRLVQLRLSLDDTTIRTQQGLAIAPLALLEGQLRLVTVRQRYLLPWRVRWQQTRRAIALVSFALSLWRRSRRR